MSSYASKRAILIRNSLSILRNILPVMRVIVSVSLLTFLLTTLDKEIIFSTLAVADLGYIGIAVTTFMVGQILSAWRYLILVGMYGKKVSLAYAVRIHFIGLYFNQLLPSSTGGDVVKGYYAAKILTVAHSAITVLADRVYGLVILSACVLIFVVPYYRLWGDDPLFYYFIIFSILILLSAPLVLLSLKFLQLKFFRVHLLASKYFKIGYVEEFCEFLISSTRKKNSIALFMISLAIHFIGIATFYQIAKAFDVQVSFFDFTLMVPLVFLVALLPFSIAGWGIREVGAIWFLGEIGVPDNEAMLISIVFGVVLLVVSLPGFALFHVFKGTAE